jgi:hypothetical protein
MQSQRGNIFPTRACTLARNGRLGRKYGRGRIARGHVDWHRMVASVGMMESSTWKNPFKPDKTENQHVRSKLEPPWN